MKILDLTHTLSKKTPVYPGDPLPSIEQIAKISNDGFNDFKVSSGMHVGTHMDAPLHMIKNGQKIADIQPESFFGEGVLVDSRGEKEVGESLLKDINLNKNSVVLVNTGFSKRFYEEEYFTSYPEISEDFAKELVKHSVKWVGMDTPSPDREPYNVHKILLGNGVLIVENLTNLNKLRGVKKFEVIALPAKYDTEAAPVRVVARY